MNGFGEWCLDLAVPSDDGTMKLDLKEHTSSKDEERRRVIRGTDKGYSGYRSKSSGLGGYVTKAPKNIKNESGMEATLFGEPNEGERFSNVGFRIVFGPQKR